MTLLAGLGVIGIAIVVMTILVKAFSCKHSWEFVDKTEFQPPVQEYVKAGGSRLHTWYMSTDQIKSMSKKTVVIVLRCPKCGEAKILRETH
jgi:hypothetical protein